MFRAQERYGHDPSIVVRTKTWTEPLKWQRMAAEQGEFEMVFTCSWSDWFHEDADEWRDEAWGLIRRCSNLVFQVLTKRPERILVNLPQDWSRGYENVWLGVSVENNDHLWRVDALRSVPARVRFISAEPLLGPLSNLELDEIDWLIVGGESGPRYREMKNEWARELRDLALNSGVAFFFKQSAAPRTEMGTLLDGVAWREYPPIRKL